MFLDNVQVSVMSKNYLASESKQILNLINAYRRFGYLKAKLDPLNLWEERV